MSSDDDSAQDWFGLDPPMPTFPRLRRYSASRGAGSLGKSHRRRLVRRAGDCGSVSSCSWGSDLLGRAPCVVASRTHMGVGQRSAVRGRSVRRRDSSNFLGFSSLGSRTEPSICKTFIAGFESRLVAADANDVRDTSDERHAALPLHSEVLNTPIPEGWSSPR
jgi:hypothetical protein